MYYIKAKKFQFLIGRLITVREPLGPIPVQEFQFLIGRLITDIQMTAKRYLRQGFNSS